jgi:hypothetical protein
MDGDMADGGGDFTVVSFILELLESTVLLLVESVTITSDCAKANDDMTKSTISGNFLCILISYVDFVFRMSYNIIYDKNVLYIILNIIKRKNHGTQLYDI